MTQDEMKWPTSLPRDPDKINFSHVLGILNTQAPGVYAQNCRASNESIVPATRLMANILADLIRVNRHPEHTTQQQLAFHDFWAGFGSLVAAANTYMLGYPSESLMILRSALLTVYQTVYYCSSEDAFQKIVAGEGLNSKKAVNHARKVFPKIEEDGKELDHIGTTWGFLSTHFGHASSAMAYARRTFSSETMDNLKLGPRLHSDEHEKEFWDATGVHLCQAGTHYLWGLRLVYPFLDPIE